MKKKFAVAAVLMFLLLPFSLYAGMGYYNLAIMDTAQMQKSGSFMIVAVDDLAYPTEGSFINNGINGRLSYVIVDGLEAALSYNHVLFIDGAKTDSNPVTAGLNLRYAVGLGDVVRLSVGAGFGFPVSKDKVEFTFSGMGETQFIPALCVSAKLGTIGLHLMVKDMMNFSTNEMINWLNVKGSVAFEATNSLIVALTGGVDSFDKSMFLTGGLEINWNIAGPLQLGIGAFGTKMDESLFIRGLVKVGLVL